jgi:hypothetical protein
MQVHERQYLGHLRTLAAPRRDDRAAEPAALAGVEVGPLVVDPRRLDLDGPGGGRDGAGLGMSVAHDQAVPRLVALVGVRLDVGLHLGLEGGQKHAPGALAHNLVQRRNEVFLRLLVAHYSEHWRSFLRQRCNAGGSSIGQ